ncbi:MAG TPA: BPSS1780 family membrane protein [Rhizobacter sp.]|nr:BPSS1780 family membrane protein [Rhizobacter sp.]
MQLKLVPAPRGALWVRQGFSAFALRPIAFSGLFTLFLFFVLVTLMIPWVGPVLLLTSLPLVTVAFMIATQQALQGRAPMPSVLVEPLRRGPSQVRALLRLGILYALASFVIVVLSDVLDGGKFQALQQAVAGGKPEVFQPLLDDPQLQLGVLLRLAFAGLLAIPFWHAPALVHWGGLSAGKALFFSSVACWRNKAAFLVFGLAWAAVIMLAGLAANLLVAAWGQAESVALMTVPVALLVSTVFYTSLFFTFADCFDLSAPTPPLDAKGPST